MTEIYCDASTGDDSTGDGSTGSPYATIQKCIDEASAGDAIRPSNVAAFVISTALVWTGGYGGGNSTSNRLKFQAWDNGGSITTTHGKVAFEVDCNDVAASVLSTASAPNYVDIQGMKAHSSTGALMITKQNWVLIDSEFYDGDGTASVELNSFYSRIINCIIRDPANGTHALELNGACSAIGCKIYGGVSGNSVAITLNADGWEVIDCEISDFAGSSFGHVFGSRHMGVFYKNTVIGTGANNQEGVQVSGHSNVIISNMFAGYSGAGANVFKSGGNQAVKGNNAFYDNTAATNYTTSVDLTGDDVTEASDPFVDSGAGNYEIDSGADSYEAGYPDGL